jgi:PAS domain S-box-containing protein
VFAADGTVREANPAAADFFDADLDWLEGRTFVELKPPDRRAGAHERFERLFTGEDTLVTLEFNRRDGERRPVEVHANSTRLGDEDALLIYMRDITDRLERERTLRRLGRRQESILERERERISREVHDVLGQALTALRMDVSWVSSHLDDERTPDRLEEAGQRINETIATVRRIAHELRPGMLDDFGLSAAIEWHAKQYSRRNGIDVHVAAGDVPALDGDLATTVFRIFQELMTNVARHADASEVDVSLNAPGDNLVLSVRDDGVGMDLEDVDHSGSLGITGVRERLGPWNGRLDLTSSPGDGTRADVIVPLTLDEQSTP